MLIKIGARWWEIWEKNSWPGGGEFGQKIWPGGTQSPPLPAGGG